MNKQVQDVFIHCSDSSWGTALEIDRWHKARGWDRIGYLCVIGNGKPFSGMVEPWNFADGNVEWGRPLDDDTILESGEIEAQVFGWNDRSVGICLIGKPDSNGKCHFTQAQLLKAKEVVLELLNHFSLTADAVKGHGEVDKGKICPGIDMNDFRAFIKGEMNVSDLLQD